MHFSESSILSNFFITVSRFHSILKYLKRQLSDIILHATPIQLDALSLIFRTYNQNDFKKLPFLGLLTAFNFLIITIEMIGFLRMQNFRFLNIILLKKGRVFSIRLVYCDYSLPSFTFFSLFELPFSFHPGEEFK